MSDPFTAIDGLKIVTHDASTGLPVHSCAGSFGCVYYGLYQTQAVAVKTFELGSFSGPHSLTTALLRGSYENERDALLQLKNPRFVAGHVLHQTNVMLSVAGETRTSPFVLVMEHVAGLTMEAFIRRARSEDVFVGQLLAIARCVARGLEELHSCHPHPIIHRDLSLRNIMVAPEDGAAVWGTGGSIDANGSIRDLKAAKLIDLGLAQFSDARATESSTATHATQHTPGFSKRTTPSSQSGGALFHTQDMYSAPEIIFARDHENRPFYSAATDMYAFAIVLHQLFERTTNPWKQGETSVDRFGQKTALRCFTAKGQELFYPAWKEYVYSQAGRPEFSDQMPAAAKAIIEQCWQHLQGDRPNAGNAAKLLKTAEIHARQKLETYVLEQGTRHDAVDFCSKSDGDWANQACHMQLSSLKTLGDKRGLSERQLIVAASQCLLPEPGQPGSPVFDDFVRTVTNTDDDTWLIIDPEGHTAEIAAQYKAGLLAYVSWLVSSVQTHAHADTGRNCLDFTSPEFQVQRVTAADCKYASKSGELNLLEGQGGLFAVHDVPAFHAVGFFCGQLQTTDDHESNGKLQLYRIKDR